MPIRRGDDTAYTLASNLSGNGNAVALRGGEYHFIAEGTVGGSTVSLQIQSPNGTWTDISVYSGSKVSATVLPYSQAGIVLPAGNYRMAATGGTPSGLFAYLIGTG